jgi:hypothetical protein
VGTAVVSEPDATTSSARLRYRSGEAIVARMRHSLGQLSHFAVR